MHSLQVLNPVAPSEGELKIGGNYVPLLQDGRHLHISGQVPRVGDQLVVTGRAGADVLGPSSAFGWQVKDTWDRALADRTTDEAVEFFESRGLSAFPVNNYETLFADPQVQHLHSG